jgi:hypothetical protein
MALSKSSVLAPMLTSSSFKVGIVTLPGDYLLRFVGPLREREGSKGCRPPRGGRLVSASNHFRRAFCGTASTEVAYGLPTCGNSGHSHPSCSRSTLPMAPIRTRSMCVSGLRK